MTTKSKELEQLIDQEIDFYLEIHPRQTSICLTIASDQRLNEDNFLASLLLFTQQANEMKDANEGNHVIFDEIGYVAEH